MPVGFKKKKKKSGKESQYMVSRPELGSDLSFGESGCDMVTIDICTKRLARKAQSVQGWPISFPNCRVALDFALSDN